MTRHFILILTILVCWTVLPSFGQTATTHKIPTAAQAAMQQKPVHRKGMMGRTTNAERWAAAIKKADRRAPLVRAGRKGGQ
ncbi:MAG: hypothetical protein DMG68_21430 [Acidobacteria bacterium]|nr:MAG: hypothetical protein DMG68_21430 [Acidobacteriota bacterium]